MNDERPFWQTRTLAQMSDAQWESLCDGCGRCCLHKLQDADSGEIAFTDVACRLLERHSCRCRDYAHRSERVPGCISMAPGRHHAVAWLPVSCAYRRIAEGRDLAWWHPLVSGDAESVHRAGVSLRGRCVSEADVPPDDIDERLVSFIEWRPLRRRSP